MKEITYQVLDIIRGTTVDGPGFRTSIYLAGCNHHCKGCHNPQSWNPSAGVTMSLQEIMNVVLEEDFNVTLSGGDPLFNPESTAILIQSIIQAGYTVWLYTGYTEDEIRANERLLNAVKGVETVVEGPFIEALKDPSLRFRGSSNQKFVHFD
jgi:anaerobic ribonucleoside-triphosphate reductase activating protein